MESVKEPEGASGAYAPDLWVRRTTLGGRSNSASSPPAITLRVDDLHRRPPRLQPAPGSRPAECPSRERSAIDPNCHVGLPLLQFLGVLCTAGGAPCTGESRRSC